MSNLSSKLTYKESMLNQTQRDLQELKTKLKEQDHDLNKIRVENAKFVGRIEMLQVKTFILNAIF